MNRFNYITNKSARPESFCFYCGGIDKDYPTSECAAEGINHITESDDLILIEKPKKPGKRLVERFGVKCTHYWEIVNDEGLPAGCSFVKEGYICDACGEVATEAKEEKLGPGEFLIKRKHIIDNVNEGTWLRDRLTGGIFNVTKAEEGNNWYRQYYLKPHSKNAKWYLTDKNIDEEYEIIP